MSQKGFALGTLILIVSVFLGFVALFWYFETIKDNPAKAFQSTPLDSKKIFEEKNKVRMSGKNKNGNPLSTEGTTISNPASEYCIKVGGTLQTETRGDGGEYNICNFEDNQSCEEWALYKKDCPAGGIKTVGYDTPEEIYCVQIGGETQAVPNSKCTLPNGDICTNSDLYNGKCQ